MSATRTHVLLIFLIVTIFISNCCDARKIVARAGLEVDPKVSKAKRTVVGNDKFVLHTDPNNPVIMRQTFRGSENLMTMMVYVVRVDDENEPSPPNYSASIVYGGPGYNEVTVLFTASPNAKKETMTFEIEQIGWVGVASRNGGK